MYHGNPRNWKPSGRGQAAASILPHMRANDTWQDAVRYHDQYAFDGNDQDGDYTQDYPYCDENESVLDDTSSVGWNGAAQFDRCRQYCSSESVNSACFIARVPDLYVSGPSGSVIYKYGSGSFPFLIKVLRGLK
jgi:hypothetical protein